ncbi:MAG TPA: hypothetical protein VGM77_07335 [Gemmatimonadales bacterium]
MHHSPAASKRSTLTMAVIGLAFGVVAATMTGCSTSPALDAPDDSAPVAPQGPVINQAVVYDGHRVAFDKSGNGNGNGSGACSLPDSLVLDVGPNGGSLSENGTSLVFPRFALLRTVHIVMIPRLGATASVQFYPEGLLFNPLALPTLTINTDCIGNPPKPVIVYTNLLGVILQFLRSIVGPGGHAVSAKIAHFSRYAVAW